MSDDGITVAGLRNLGNTCFLNAVLQSLASSRATIEHLLQQASQASQDEQPLAIAVLDCLYSLRCQQKSGRRCSASPKAVLSAVREYISADCLVDGQQNDSAEVLEVLCDALATEEQTKLSVHRYVASQLPWRNLLSMVSSDLIASNCLAAGSQAAHNTVHQDARFLHKQASICSDKLQDHVSDSSSSSSSSNSSSNSRSSSTEEEVAGGASSSGRRWPMEGNTVNDMMCITCQHCFVSQHSPFSVLPLALPTTRMSQGVRGRLQMYRTVVVRNTSLLQCLAALCLPEVINGVHCPRCTLRAAMAAWKSKEGVQQSSSSRTTAATAAASGDAKEVASLSGTAQPAELRGLKASCTQSEAAAASSATAARAAVLAEEAQLGGGAANSLEDTSEEAGSPTAGASETQDDKGAGAPATAQATTLSAASSEVQDTQGVAVSAADEAGALSDAATGVQDDEGLAASASAPSASHTAAAAAEEGPTGAQLRCRGVIEGLLRSRAPWPDMDFEGLVGDAGLKWSPVGSMCVKRIALGQAPKVLFLHLRRAYWTNTGCHMKLSGHIRFPLALTLAPYSAANMPALSSLSQQYVPDAAQSFWMRSAGDAPGGGGSGGDGSGGGGGRGGTGDTSGGSGDGSSGHANDNCGGGGDGGGGGTVLAANHATATPASDRSTGAAGIDAQAEASTGARNAAAAILAEPTPSGAWTGASTGDHNASNSSSTASSGEAPARAEEIGRPQRSDSPAAGSSPFASAGKAAEQGNQSSWEGQMAAPGLAQRLLASHALSLTSSLTSESSLLNDSAFDQDAGNESQHSVKLAPTAAAADESAAKSSEGISVGWARQGKSPKGPLQRVLASHPLSLASCLSSEASMSTDFMPDGTATPSATVDAMQPLMRKAPAPKPSCLQHAEQGLVGEVSDGTNAAGSIGNVSSLTADTGVDIARAKGDCVTEASTGFDEDGPSSFQLDAGAQDVDCSRASPRPTELLLAESSDDDLSAQQLVVQKGKEYRLVAAVVHHGGGSGSGHYTVYRRVRLEGQQQYSPQDHWFSISDEHVHQVDVCDVLDCEATLLTYEQ